jgi:hypothetical protein
MDTHPQSFAGGVQIYFTGPLEYQPEHEKTIANAKKAIKPQHRIEIHLLKWLGTAR